MQFSTNIKGINKDLNSSQQTEDMYSFVLNGTVENFSESQPFPYIGNTPSNVEYLEFSPGDKIISYINIIELNSVIYAVYNTETNLSSFIKVEYIEANYLKTKESIEGDCNLVIKNNKLDLQYTSTVLLSTECFQWENTRLNIEYKLTDCSVNLYFVNGVDEDRYIYFNLDWSIHDNFLNNGNLECNNTKWNPELYYPCINVQAISGGEKLNGQYNYLLAYSTSKGIPITPFIGLTTGINLFNIGKENSNKGVQLTISNVQANTQYDYYTIVGLEHINGISNYFIKGVYPISQSIVFDLENKGIPISLQELVTKLPFYKNSKFITTSNNILFKAGLKEYEKFNLQPVINNVELKWVTKVLKEGDYKDKKDDISYLRDEVYSFSIQPILSNGEQLPNYVLINREANQNDLEFVSIEDKNNIQEKECLATFKPRWQVYNTATKTYTNTKPISDLYKECEVSDEIYEKGNFAYWESVEKYPNVPEVWGSLANTNIRHFKFPDHNVTLHHSNASYNEDVYIFPIGVSVESDMNLIFDSAVTQGLITQEQRDRIIGWKLLRSNRLGNTSVIAKGILYDVWEYEREFKDENFTDSCTLQDSTKYYFPSFPFNDLNPDKLLASNSDFYTKEELPTPLTFNNTGKFTFHSPNTSFIEPDLGSVLKLESILTGNSLGFFNIAEEQAMYKLLNSKHFNLAVSISKWIASKNTSPNEAAVQQTFENVGSTIGGAIGSVPGLSFVGALGGILGGFIGSKIYNSNTGLRFIDSMWRNTIVYSEVEKFTALIKNLMKAKQYHYQYQAVGKYNNITPILNTEFIQRPVEANYLESGKYTINNKFINNEFRESSVFLQTDIIPTIKNEANELIDKSKVIISDNSESTENTVIVTKTKQCKKYSIKRNTFYKTKAFLWGELCIPLFLDNNPNNLTIGTIHYINNNTGNNIIQGSSTIENTIVEIKEDGNAYIIEELIYAINTGCLVLCQKGSDNYNVKNPSDILETQCYSNINIRKYKGDADEDEDFSSIIDIQGIEIEEVEQCPEANYTIEYTERKGCDCSKEITTDIASYYGSLKKENKNQYGTVYDIRWVTTGSCLNESYSPIFGGDTYINRFTFKRKHSLFNNTAYNLPLGTDINYSLLGNAAYPMYYFDTLPKTQNRYISTLGGLNFPINGVSDFVIDKIFPIWGNYLSDEDNYLNQPKTRFDCNLTDIDNPYREKNNELSFNSIEGLMYLYYYGIPSFIVESEINLDLRDIGQTVSEDFYPHQSDLSFWLQEKNVSINTDNSYIYNTSFSKQPTEEFYYLYDVNFKGNEDCKTEKNNRIIYTNQDSVLADDDLSDIYLLNRALDYYDFSLEDGKLISISGIENDKVLVRQENNSSVFGAYIEINTNEQTALISSGSIFKSKPIQFTKPSLGYFGSQHQDILHTPFGHIFIDSKRGYVFNLKNGKEGLEEISNKGMKHWFKENLPFTIKKYFNNVNIDDNFNGIGLTMCYDYRMNTFYLTKLDYEPINKNITYTNGFYLDDVKIEIENPKYFKNKSFTISFNFYTQQWQSFHSFTPDFYVEHINHFDSFKKNKIWKHNVTNKSYQMYYGKLYPFIVETISKNEYNNNIVQDVSFMVDVLEYINDYDSIYKSNKSFNKAIVYNERQNSGLLELDKKTNNLQSMFKYPIFTNNSAKILLNIKENFHSFNQFKDIVKSIDQLIWLRSPNNVLNKLNIFNLDYKNRNINNNYIRDFQNKVQLIQDKEHEFHYIFKGLLINNGNSKRI